MSSPYKPYPTPTLHTPHNISPSPIWTHVTTSPPSSRIITTAGQIGADANHNIPSHPDDQIALAFYNLRQCLEASGARVQDILKLTYYIVNYDPNHRRHTPHLVKFLEGHKPATTLVPVTALAVPEYIFEIEATAAIPYDTTTREVDVVVVGGGLSGLKAAWDIQKAGLSCVVLEARDRVGGKTWSRDSVTGKVDVGAAWINDSNQSYMWELAKGFGLETVVQNTKGRVLTEYEGGFWSAEYGKIIDNETYARNVESIRNLLEDLCQKIDIYNPVASGLAIGKDLDAMTVEEYVKSVNYSAEAMGNVQITTRALLGVEPNELSAFYLLDYLKSGGGLLRMRSDLKDGGQYLRLVKGTQEFSNRIASELHPSTIQLSSPVRSIQQTPNINRILTTTPRGTFLSKRLILSIPTPLYKEIAFSPPLPPAKNELANSTTLGYYAKAIAVYDRPWWRDAGCTGMIQSDIGPAGVMRDTSVESVGHYSLTCFMVGQPGREWGSLGEKERERKVLEQIENAFGKVMREKGKWEVPKPREIVETRWAREQWSQGCPCPVMPPNILTRLGHALRSTHGGIHFVGTETAYEWKGYMEGAVRSGERGAREVVKILGGAKL